MGLHLYTREIRAVVRIATVAAIIGSTLALCSVGVLLLEPQSARYQQGPPVPSHGPEQPTRSVEARPESKQNEYINSLITDRAALYNGTASARLRQQTDVGESFPISLLVCAPSTSPCYSASPTDSSRRPHSTPPPDVRNLGNVTVGGRVQVELTWHGIGATVRALSPTEQTIAEPGDVAEWRWSVLVGKEPGQLHLQIGVTSLRGDSAVPLFPTRFFDLDVEVEDTVQNRTNVIGSALGKFTVGAGTGIAALGGTIVAYLTYRRARRERAGRAVAEGLNDGPADGGSGRGPRKRRRRKPPGG
ncbi:hypothetical protein O7631_30925 [Micromonospora sp. WMMD967]|uniref:hypothetical protein n=1 Tax=Micromonospora sp. WMMD967 TaxID=3016101 RepID=UPI0024165393|nr:hypothetical protein [Micromonospora sp. WMMD967]MDG4840961.1 hypothetical protein [Micromonospora sp. WMMD967]